MESSAFHVPHSRPEECDAELPVAFNTERGTWNAELSPPLPADAHLAVGVDLVEVARVRGAWERHGERFLARVFTVGERADCGGRIASLAARFAAKEAAAKALGTGIGAVGWRDIEVRTEGGGRPTLILHAAAAAAARTLGLPEWHVSLSHTHTLAIAYVVAHRGSVAR